MAWNFPALQEPRAMIDLGQIGPFGTLMSGTDHPTGYTLFCAIVTGDKIGRCLNLTDGMSMAAYEYCFYEFRGARVFLWQSTVFDNEGNQFVPWIQAIRGQMPIIYWLWLAYPINIENSLGLLLEA